MGCPTKEEYEEAMNTVVFLKNSISMEKKRREELIDKLCTSQKILKDYEKILEEKKEIVDKYRIYQEILTESRR